MLILDSVCMLFMVIGENIKRVDKYTNGELLTQYTDVDWRGVMGFRDVIAHHYFDIDAEQVHWIVENELDKLISNIQLMITNEKINR